MPEKNTVQVDFEPIGKRVTINSGQTLLEAAQKGGIALLSVCGGNGLCQDCKVKVIQGKVSQITPMKKQLYQQQISQPEFAWHVKPGFTQTLNSMFHPIH